MASGTKLPAPRQLDTLSGDRGAANDKERQRMLTVTDPVTDGSENVPSLDARLQDQIGSKLKAMFDQVAREPIPDKFLNLLRELDGKEGGK